MFAVSWLDMRRLPVRIDAAAPDAQYVSVGIETNGVMLWFIVDESGGRTCAAATRNRGREAQRR
ncbi:hypothetical protein [Micrococcus sp. TA1]|uniref:hypothetical protein n=1 Tax=Micrococcus sp. TA1 TaxID=681627 RepID=UPI0016079A9C|nr:hypothetical protein [Micrococcus sp. TA1]MBB5750307.1 hypothetical protein [Micrococcus sp. TA1]